MDKKLVAKKVLERLVTKGFQAYLVGGYVRDILLNRPTTDIDIATNAKPNDIIEMFEKSIPTGLKHGTVTVLFEGLPVEITTFRKEGKYSDYRHPENVEFVTNLFEDLGRRDFTMNAIAMDLNDDIIDPYNGEKAILQRRIESVGNPSERFLEDPLRMMRAVRFASQLGFKIESSTYQAIEELAPYLSYIAVERIKVELDKVLQSQNVSLGINLFFSLRLFHWIKGNIGVSLMTTNPQSIIEVLEKTTDYELRWAVLLLSLNEEQRLFFMEGLRFSNKEKQSIVSIFKAYSFLRNNWDIINFKKCLIETNRSSCLKALEFHFIMESIVKEELEKYNSMISILADHMTVWTRKDLRITGKDIISKIKKPAGVWIQKLLDDLFFEVVYNDLPNDRELLLRRVEQLREKISDEGEN